MTELKILEEADKGLFVMQHQDSGFAAALLIFRRLNHEHFLTGAEEKDSDESADAGIQWIKATGLTSSGQSRLTQLRSA